MVSVPISVTTAGAVTREPTVHTHARTLTVAVHHLADIRPPPSSPISSPRPATMATVTPSPVDATGTAEGQATRGSVLARALQLRWSAIERGNGIESAALTNSPQRNTSTSVPPATVARGGRGSGPGRTTGRGSAATRANTTAAVAAGGTPAMDGTGAELHQDHHLV